MGSIIILKLLLRLPIREKISYQLRGRTVTGSKPNSPSTLEQADTKTPITPQQDGTTTELIQDYRPQIEAIKQQKEQLEELHKLREQVLTLSTELGIGEPSTNNTILVSRPRTETKEPELKGRDIIVKDLERLPNNPSFKQQRE